MHRPRNDQTDRIFTYFNQIKLDKLPILEKRKNIIVGEDEEQH